MIKTILFKIANVAVVLIGISFLSFTLLHLAPGNPAEKYLTGSDGNAGTISEEAIRAQEEKWGLDKPFLVQYLVWLGNAFRGDLGNSYSTGRPVITELLQKIGPTMILSVAALFVTLLVSIPLGVWCAVYRDRLLDHIVRIFSFCGISLPSFLSSLVILYLFGVHWKWIPIVSQGGFLGLLFPTLVLAFQCSARFTRQVRAVVLEQLGKEYVRGAVARGVKPSQILLTHVLRNTWLPIVTWVGVYFGVLLGGAAIVETIFSWQGIGQLAVESVSRHDYTMIQGIVLWMALLYLLVNFLVDASYSLLDPRVRMRKGVRLS